MKTTVINLFAGPGVGKSTLASELYATMKSLGEDVELVREYVKDWVWEGKKIGKYDQPYIFGKQVHMEGRLYGTVRYIITDSPFFLSPFYERITFGTEITLEAAHQFMSLARENDVEYLNFYLARTGKYVAKGRLQTLAKAKETDVALQNFLSREGISYIVINKPFDERVQAIMEHLK